MKPWLYIAVFSASALAPASYRVAPAAPSQGETRPASDPRILEAQSKIEQIQQFANKLQRKESVNLDNLESEFPMPGRDADKRTRELRDQVLTLEEAWVAARAARAVAVDSVEQVDLVKHEEAVEEDSPTPHALAETQAVPLATVRFRRGRHEKALESLKGVNTAEARYLEVRCLDALDRVEDALAAYKAARALAAGDRHLLSTIDRDMSALDWKVKFGKPSDLMNPIRNSKFTGFLSLQKPPESKDSTGDPKPAPEESHGSTRR